MLTAGNAGPVPTPNLPRTAVCYAYSLNLVLGVSDAVVSVTSFRSMPDRPCPCLTERFRCRACSLDLNGRVLIACRTCNDFMGQLHAVSGQVQMILYIVYS